jgi:hypothetical protein
MRHPALHRRHRDRGQRRQRIGVRQVRHHVQKSRKIVPVQGLRRHPCKKPTSHRRAHHVARHPPAQGQRPSWSIGAQPPRMHQVVQRRVRGPGVEGQARARMPQAQAFARIGPGDVAHAAEVQERHRPVAPIRARAGPVVERRQRRALPAHLHIRGPEIPDHHAPRGLRQPRAVARLMGAPVLRIMGQRLAVKAQRVDLVQPLAKRRMRGLHHPRRSLGAVIARPGAQRAAQHRSLLVGIGPVARLAQRQDIDAVRLHHGQVDPVQRGPRHEPRDGPARPVPLFLHRPARYSPGHTQNGRDAP